MCALDNTNIIIVITASMPLVLEDRLFLCFDAHKIQLERTVYTRQPGLQENNNSDREGQNIDTYITRNIVSLDVFNRLKASLTHRKLSLRQAELHTPE